MTGLVRPLSQPLLQPLLAGLLATRKSPEKPLPVIDRILPSLALRFADNTYQLDSGSGLEDKTFADIITFTRASGGGRFNASGVYEWLGNNVPRLDYDPVTLQPRGILIEEQRTNRLLNSAVVVTQSITTTATANTLSFYGTGSITLSGTATGTLVGTGASNRVSLTFTPTAGTLTLTVTGSCTAGQLEAGSSPTSYIPTVASQVTRSADVASVNTLSPWYNASEGTLFAEASIPNPIGATNHHLFGLGDGTINNFIAIRKNANPSLQFVVTTAGATVVNIQSTSPSGVFKAALAMQDNNVSAASDGLIVGTDLSNTVPAVSALRIGALAGYGQYANGHIRNISYYPRAYSGIVLQEMT